MIALRLGGAPISLTRAFIPLWVVDGVVLVGALVVLCRQIREDWEYTKCSTLIYTCLLFLLGWSVVAMLPLFKILLAAVDAGTLVISMRLMCIPLFIFFGIACAGLTFSAFLTGGDRLGRLCD